MILTPFKSIRAELVQLFSSSNLYLLLYKVWSGCDMAHGAYQRLR